MKIKSKQILIKLHKECKKEIIDEQKNLKENLKNEIRNRLVEFVKNDRYQDVLIKSIDERINKDWR